MKTRDEERDGPASRIVPDGSAASPPRDRQGQYVGQMARKDRFPDLHPGARAGEEETVRYGMKPGEETVENRGPGRLPIATGALQ